MSLSSSLNPKLPSEPFSHPPGAPREPEVDQCTICPELGEETIRPEQAQDSLDPSEYFHGGPRGTEPAANAPRTPAPSSHEETAGSKVHERPVSGHDVLEAEHDSLQLCLLGLGLRLQDMEQGLRPWTLAQSGMAQLQALQAELRGAAERVDSLLAFGEGLVQRSEPMAWASLEQILRTLRAYRHTIFRRLWQLQAQLVSYSLDILVPGFSHWEHLGGHRRRPLLQKPQDKKRQASPNLQDMMLEAADGDPAPASRRPRTFLLVLLIFLLLVGATLFLRMLGGPCCSHGKLARTPYLVLSYVNGLPPV
ncbi:nesprin-4 isoform X4 [Cavia porcellus]|uniref:Spectrin repeat containing nuclear envelope family member 4 n=1 Tax=Cavia porcellus TaxID=10141 RepID=A0A286XKH3_CAVPO